MADASITQKTTVPPSPNGLMLRAKSMWQRKTRATESEDAQSTDCEAGQNKKPALKPLSYFRLYSEADSFDIFLIVVGTIGAIGAGAALPGFTLVFGDVINSFNPSSASVADVNAAIVSSVNDVCLNFVYIAAASLVASYLEVAAWMVAGLRQANRIRQHFLRSALRQEVAYYDTDANTGVLLQGLNEDTNAVQNAIGEKVGQCLHHLATFVGGIAIAFWKGWKLTLVMIACVPALMICGALLGTLMGKMSTRANDAYGRANSIVQQALGGIRTVMSFNAQTKTVATYRSALTLPQKVAVRQGLLSGCTMGLIMLVMYGSYALALWYGATRIIAGEMNGGDVLTVLFAVLMGSFSLGQAAPLLQHFVNGKTAGARVWAVINRVPAIADDPASQQPARVTGRIELQNVGFSYPARRDIQIFSTLNMNINSGETVALVGESGSGKSTVVSLIMRFYDPSQGIVKLDGVDIRSLPLGWLRRQIGLVSQEPCLFQTSIFNNIKYGLPDATAEQVYAASRAANAHVFIKNLPDGYDTHVGEKGTQMSGGQKQRIALARAILRDPKILLLDEATSALDTVSERVVQKALEKLMPGRTTVVVAHRLSTIRPFRIAVMKAGKVVEVGTHSELLANQSGAYSTLVRLQNQRHAAEEHVDEEPVTEEDIVTEEHAVGSRRVLSSFQQKNDVEADEEVVPAGRRRCLPWKRKKAAEAEAKKEPEVNVSFARLLKLNKPELPVAILGCLASAVLGAQMPAFSIALSSIITVFYESFDSMRSSAAKWAGIFCAIGVGTFLGSFVQQAAFAFMGAKLARRIRVLTFSTILRQELSWFDDERHASGAVSTRLANDASSIRGAASDQLGLLVQNLVTVVGSLVIAFIYGPAMTGVVLSVVPLLGLAGWFQAKFMTGFSSEADTLFSTANQMAQEGISNIRTCQAFAMEVPISSLYRDLLRDPTKSSERRAHVAGAGFGFSQGCMFAVYALAFWFGAKQVSEGKMTFEDVLKVFFAVLLMALGVSQSTMAFPDVTKAKSAIQNVFTLVDTPPCSINVDAPGEEPLKVSAHIELVSVSFSYPSRPNVQVFRDFSLNVPAGATVALVGPSGSGKSTVVSLVQRFYDPTAGQVLFDGVHIRTLQLKWLRSHIGVVSQEPVLFSTSIADNILFGNEGASMEDVAAAAKAANAGFVLDLPEGFNTQVGEAGIQLSGGQKQRIAIARALIKNPRVLLLDEATSALDAESEAAVQVALNAAAAERTTIIVAHRLSTIRNATSIAVVQDGHILEEGTHSELMALGGSYTQLVRHQAAS